MFSTLFTFQAFHLIFMERDQIWVIYHFDQIRQIDRLNIHLQ